MGRRDYLDKKPTLGQGNNSLLYLFAINAFVFITLRFLKLVYDLDYGSAAYELFSKKILFWFTLSPQAHDLVQKIWTPFIYMFSHYSIWGFISNMLWLWAFGYVLQDLVGNKKLIPLYLYGGFFSGLFYIALASYIPSIHNNIDKNFLLEGCNAAILSIAVGTTKLSPRYRIFQHIGEGFYLWILTLIYIAVDITYIYTTNAAVGFAHIMAALVGYIFIVQLQNGNDWSRWMYKLVKRIDNFFNPEKKFNTKKATYHYYNQTVDAYNKTENVTEKKLNEILDKINSKGYSGLSKEEKEFLERASKEV